MKLPNCERAVVAREKITDYLLSTVHEDGAAKARFFQRFGFSGTAWEVIARALREHACAHDVAGVTTTEHGTRYRVEGTIDAPDGRRPRVRSIWIIEPEGDTPRFVTAYPLGREPA